ncbi:MAG: inositol monophosphatase family protein [Promethearchaeota archaeon]
MPSSIPSSTQRLWRRLLRNAAGLGRLRVLDCITDGSCHETIGTGAGGDITKQFDAIAEQTMVEYVARFASFTLMSEETGVTQVGNNPEGFLIMDPIDGSTNVNHNIRFACIAIAYASELVFDEVEVAVVMDLFSGKSYHAIKGCGAFCDQTRISSTGTSSSEIQLVGVDAVYPPESLERFSKETGEKTIQYTRHFGANALEMCFVADGSLDGFIDLRGVFRGTDLAAVSLILKEAGATLVNEKGAVINGPCTNEARYSYIAARNQQVANKLLKLTSMKKTEQ